MGAMVNSNASRFSPVSLAHVAPNNCAADITCAGFGIVAKKKRCESGGGGGGEGEVQG